MGVKRAARRRDRRRLADRRRKRRVEFEAMRADLKACQGQINRLERRVEQLQSDLIRLRERIRT